MYKWKLKDILFMAISAAVFGLIYLGTVYIGTFVSAALTPAGWGPFGYTPFYGIYFMAATFVAYVVRKPGIGIAAEMLAALLEVILGNQFGPIIFLQGFLQGFAVEIVFMLTRYKKWNQGTMILSAIFGTGITFVYDCFMYSYTACAPVVIVSMLVMYIVSGIFFAGILSKLIADGLNKAGVLRGYAISGGLRDTYEE